MLRHPFSFFISLFESYFFVLQNLHCIMSNTSIFLLAIILGLGFIAFTFRGTTKKETVPVCCHQANEKFVALADDPEFLAAHDLPEEINFESTLGEMITYKTPDGQEAKAYFVKSAKKSKKYLLMFQEWWGLNDHIKQEAERYAKTLGDVHVIAPDMYDGKVATTREKAGQYMQGAKPERLEAIIQGVLSHVGKDAEIATIGWCFGGGWSLRATLIAQDQAKACVMYYGMPVDDQKMLKTIDAPVLGIFATKDQWINTKVVEKFEANMKAVSKALEVKNYEAGHGFANPSSSQYKEEAAQDAYSRTIDFIKEGLN